MSDNIVGSVEVVLAQLAELRGSALSPAGLYLGGSSSQLPPHHTGGLPAQRRPVQQWQLWRPRSNSGSSDSSSNVTATTRYDDSSSEFSGPMTTLTTPSVASDDEHPTRFPIPCEFRDYLGCRETFNMVEDFITHCFVHYGPLVPPTSICWFCNDWVFDAPEGRLSVKQQYYAARLWHIGGHYRQNDPGQIRPDHFVLDHLRTQIGEDLYRHLSNQEPRRLRLRGLDLSLYSGQHSDEPFVMYLGGSQGRERREARQDRYGNGR